jgi:CheY-like chemotaxis protein
VAKEKRKSARGDVSATVVLLKNESPLGNFRVLNLSSGGALLVGRAPKTSSRAARFDVLVRLSTGRTVRAAAAVVREESVEDSSVFAIEFEELESDDRDAIDNLLLTTIEDERDPTVLVIVDGPELRQLLRRQLKGLGHPSFGVGTREDAVRFLEEPNNVAVALIDLGLEGKQEADKVLAYLQKQHPKVRRIVVTADPLPAGRKSAPPVHPLAHQVIGPPWTRDALARALLN